MWADDVHELLELAKALAVPSRHARSLAVPDPRASTRRGDGLAIMTCSGGDSAQGADEAAAARAPTCPAFAPATLLAVGIDPLPSAATVANPLDYTADDLG